MSKISRRKLLFGWRSRQESESERRRGASPVVRDGNGSSSERVGARSRGGDWPSSDGAGSSTERVGARSARDDWPSSDVSDRAGREGGHVGPGKGGAAGANKPLPAVISWLSEYTGEEPELPRPSAAAPVLRPPGAVAEQDFLKRCTKCGDCRDACPHDAISPAPPVFRDAAGTPRIDPSTAPCRFCEDLPCASACETGALLDDGDRMGTAVVQAHECLGSMGAMCSVCQEHCPVEGAVSFRGLIPTVDKSLCVGCGSCHFACPAPVNAIAILPNPERTTRSYS